MEEICHWKTGFEVAKPRAIPSMLSALCLPLNRYVPSFLLQPHTSTLPSWTCVSLEP